MDYAANIGAVFRREDVFEVLPAGSIVFREGESGDCMYVVRSGEVDLRVAGSVVETIGPDGIFGEIALVDTEPRSATAIARSECALVRVTPKRFEFLVQQHPYFALAVMRLMAQRLRRMNTKLGSDPTT